jgi:DNA-binding NarL/FixJ family response regulator
MKKNDYGSVKMLLAMENAGIRQGLQNALQHEGYQRPFEVGSHEKLLAALNLAPFDVIVTSTDLTGEFIAPHITQLRRGALAHHPLPIVIELLTSTEGEYVKRVIDSGPDDLLQLPISTGQMITRLANLAETRKPFVVTSDYIGPDRRTGVQRPGAAVIPLIEVPNPLQMRMMRLPEDLMLFEYDACAGKLRQMRLERFAFELQWLLRAIRQLFQPEQNDADKLQTFCDRIKTLSGALPSLLSAEAAAKIKPLSERLAIGANILLKNGFSADATVLQGLAGLVNAQTQAMLAIIPREILDAAGWPPGAGAK